VKVFYIGKFWPNYRTEYYVQAALQDNGVEVIRRQMTPKCTFTGIKQQLIDHQPYFILFAKQKANYFEPLLKYCRNQNLLTVCWQWDLWWGYRGGGIPQFQSDIVLSSDGGHASLWKRKGMAHRVLRQGVHHPDHIKYDVPKTRDLLFLGNPSSNSPRRRLIKFLREKYDIRTVEGVRGLALNKLLAATKIVVGDSYPSPNYWSNRIYEVTGRGGFLLHPATVGLDAEFTPGVHYGEYKRLEEDGGKDLEAKIEYYLTHDKERELIRDQGFRHCGENYTYKSRVARMLEMVKEKLDV